ncbi:uncharacterized protein CcaverHIS019_0204750 [Cutaneotrichosporon cavernicola]|uniref:DNA repair protein RAD5 n=1 Tax=Cutaneotrichosporon cavernicola TaxID=279322 RepID=A0AA48IFE0_9TREE|nr:uncharacterized protein CcaverHIS019_0204750 [Cutaneotrichosporon cavernicola]BEI89113.1 hypothetical protein CcaverHIS019_0204750 [Cutaneotrichosporon cavernicola]BEI96889.1 hypothetical protein CcaverHIS631_0204780 [Cutaneotrichosporon cavernicola]BEJ04661.1 hypothetical protein CcaverHIS641_0204780 [Cutaneotrichosporon cavernicola]
MSAKRAIDLTDLSDSDDSPIPVAGPSGPPGLAARRPGAPNVWPSSRLSEGAKDSDDDFTITASTPAKPIVNPMFGSFPASSGVAGPSGTQFSPLGSSLASASEAAHRAGFAHFGRPNVNGSSNGASNSGVVGNSNGFATGSWVPSLSSSSSAPVAGAGDGSSSAPIDVDSMPVSRPPPPPNPKKAMCIGGFMTRAIMLYPTDAAVAGVKPKAGQRWNIVTFKGAEMIHVKLRLRKAGDQPRPDEPWTSVSQDTIQVTTYPGGATGAYIGDIDPHIAGVLIPMLHRGLCRLEGFAMRLRPDGPMFEVRINVLLFTLPSNIQYISDTLIAHNLFLLDPMPPYDPMRHNDQPVYQNAHGGGERAYKMYLASQQRYASSGGGYYNPQQDKARQVEVQRQQVDAVFKSIESGVELEQSDPGPWIKTNLFPHQRKALTFLLQAEQDWSSLKDARKAADKKLKKAKVGSQSASGTSTPDERPEKEEKKGTRDFKADSSRSLWEISTDDNARGRAWKNKLTMELRRQAKRPKECKGAILADDMGLGKTLSVVSLIAATKTAAKEWGERELEKVETPQETDEDKVPVSAMSTRVFGMPEPSPEPDTPKGKKRRRDEQEEVANRTRRSQITKRSKATLLVCPMSTITNWEDQIKEHWDGDVEVVGGTSPPVKKGVKKPTDPEDTLRVYIYHGTGRKADPRYLAGFDIVITSYSTLANEYSKHCNSCGDGESTPADTRGNSDDEASGATSARGTTTPASGINPSDVSEALKRKQKRKRAPAADQPSPLQTIDWFRVVLDEAHSIKSASTVACKASCYLEADRRIALTGTPIQNKIEDVWALFKFLRLSPIDERDMFNKYISTPCKSGDQVGVARLQLVMRTCCLRRTKDTTDNGQKILHLPPRKELQMWLDLRPDEREIYDRRRDEARSEINELKATKQLTKNYAHVLQQLLRLRQTCDHVDLPSSAVVEEDYDGTIMNYEIALEGIKKMGLTQQRAQSVICTYKDMPDAGACCNECDYDFGPVFPSIDLGGDEVYAKSESNEKKTKSLRPLLTKCCHIYCPACFKRSVYPKWPRAVDGQARPCIVCDEMLQLGKDVIEVCPPSEMSDEAPKKAAQRKKWERNPMEAVNMSSKMQYLLHELMKLSKRNPNSPNYDPFGVVQDDDDDPIEVSDDGTPLATKTIVFSQWTTMLDRVEDMLNEANIKTCRLDGTMTREQRADQIERLRTRKSIEVMLVSTRAGGVGLNLTAASRCYLIDPYWNPSVEAQAIDRIHRMGQTRPVLAVKLMIKDSVEEKLNKIQQKKAELANLSLKNMSRTELMQQRSDMLASLFN